MAIRDAVHALKHALAMRISKWDKAEAERVVAMPPPAQGAIPGFGLY